MDTRTHAAPAARACARAARRDNICRKGAGQRTEINKQKEGAHTAAHSFEFHNFGESGLLENEPTVPAEILRGDLAGPAVTR